MKKNEDVLLIEELKRLLENITDRNFFESASRGADNSKAKVFQYLGEIPPGHYFLCDCIGNTIDLCFSTRKKYKNLAGRAVTCKVIATIIPDCHKQFGTALNGEWMIPYNLIRIVK